jgi:hypothetical protein
VDVKKKKLVRARKCSFFSLSERASEFSTYITASFYLSAITSQLQLVSNHEAQKEKKKEKEHLVTFFFHCSPFCDVHRINILFVGQHRKETKKKLLYYLLSSEQGRLMSKNKLDEF